MISAELELAVRQWIDGDPDAETRAELTALLHAADEPELAERFAMPLAFGTAGLRGVVGAGPARMNRAVVMRVTRALADWLLQRVPDAKILPILLGWDGRASSRGFAEDTAGVLAAAGLTVRYFEQPVPTPLVAFAARELGACAAVVVTASHNPPEYNGYKVYGPAASQITPPIDREIAERIASGPPASAVPRIADAFGGKSPLVRPVPPTLAERYLAQLDALRGAGPADRDFALVYTPLHGVGRDLAERALRRAGFARLHVVAEQAEPDGRFPTLRFPNPEEPGSLDLALALGQRTGAELVLANDPDADRLGVCVSAPSGRFVQLTGNQIGILLADWVLSRAPPSPQPLVVATIVSSPMIAAVAAAHGARLELTLTGFKWIWLAALELERREGVRFAFGYEEALGYAAGRLVRDKDGISAALLFAELAASSRAAGHSVLERLDELYRRYGLWVSAQRSVVRPGTGGRVDIDRATDTAAERLPNVLGGRRVVSVRDFRKGGDTRAAWLGTAPLVELGLEGGGRVLVRPSGTEPKLKIYVDLPGALGASDSPRRCEERAVRRAQELAEELVAALGLS
jgi:phosphomannomutase